MWNEVIVCLDGSTFAEEILPYARGIASAAAAKLTLFRAAGSTKDVQEARGYMNELANLATADGKIERVDIDVATSILRHLRKKPRALLALTTHGRSGLLERLLGSVASDVIQQADRPILLYRPHGSPLTGGRERIVKIKKVTVALDGSPSSERILPSAVELAKILDARVEIVQAQPAREKSPRDLGHDVSESSYLHQQAKKILQNSGVEPGWEVLHGEPAAAICRHIGKNRELILAMMSHTRSRTERMVVGSVAGECVRRAGVPILVHFPAPSVS